MTRQLSTRPPKRRDPISPPRLQPGELLAYVLLALAVAAVLAITSGTYVAWDGIQDIPAVTR